MSKLIPTIIFLLFSLIIVSITLILGGIANAEVHYSSPTGTSSWAQSTNINTPCSIDTAFSNAKAGDTVNFRGGIYVLSGDLLFNNSGTSDDTRIIFQAYQNEIPYFDSNKSTHTLRITGWNNGSGRDYITIDGIYFINLSGANTYITFSTGNNNYSTGITIQNCNLDGGGIVAAQTENLIIKDNTISGYPDSGIYISGSQYYPATQTRIEGNTVNGSSSTGNDGIVIHASTSSPRYQVGDYHLVKNNVVHDSFENNYDITSGRYIVLDGNIGYNSKQSDSNLGGHSDLPMSYVRYVNHTVYDTVSGDHIMRSTYLDYVQILRSTFHGSATRNNIFIYSGTPTQTNKNTHLFHNIFDYSDVTRQALQETANDANNEVYFKNNIFYSSRTQIAADWDAPDEVTADYNLYWQTTGSPGANVWDSETIAEVQSVYSQENNAVESDPLFADAATNDYTLQSGSPAIDAGGWLTTITQATGSGTSFTVNDSYWFYDGWGITGETGDLIKTENGQTATITSINYGTNTITVGSSISWTQNEGIALSYNGSAPDIGANERPTIKQFIRNIILGL